MRIKEELKEVDLLDLYNKKELCLGDFYKIIGGPRYPMQYFFGNSAPPGLTPMLIGCFINPRQKRDVVCIRPETLRSKRRSRVAWGKGYSLKALSESGRKVYLVLKQVDEETGSIIYDRGARIK